MAQARLSPALLLFKAKNSNNMKDMLTGPAATVKNEAADNAEPAEPPRRPWRQRRTPELARVAIRHWPPNLPSTIHVTLSRLQRRHCGLDGPA
jgi:hypothetical protein